MEGEGGSSCDFDTEFVIIKEEFINHHNLQQSSMRMEYINSKSDLPIFRPCNCRCSQAPHSLTEFFMKLNKWCDGSDVVMSCVTNILNSLNKKLNRYFSKK